MLQNNTEGFLHCLRVLRYRRRFLYLNRVCAKQKICKDQNQNLWKKKTKQQKRKNGSVLCSILGAFVFLSVLFLATVGIVACLIPEVRVIVFEPFMQFMRK